MKQLRDITQLVCHSDKFLQEALKRDGTKNEDFYNNLIGDSVKARKEALCLIFIAAVIGFFIAQIVKYTCGIPSSYVSCFKFASALILGFAVLNCLKDPKSFDGTTLVEKTNTNLFKLLYSFGFGLNIFTLSLDISVPESIISTLEMAKMQSF